MDLFSTKIAYASESLNGFIANVDTKIINPLIGFLFALAVVFFLYGVFEFIANQENEEKKTAGKQHMLWGIIGITIMFGVFAIMNVMLSTFGITGIDIERGSVILQ
ncbi:MAG: hypothetical protein WC609_02390 [Candidatus Paceibacterota bacterium]|jgi:uncharacterized membrane protein YidH (DUF202 family)